MDAIAEKADVTGGDASLNAALGPCRQVHSHLENYILQSEWDTFSSAVISHDAKLMCIGKAMEGLFLLHPAEPTAAAAVAIALSADEPHSCDFLLSKLHNLKQTLALRVKSAKTTASLPDCFPECVASDLACRSLCPR